MNVQANATLYVITPIPILLLTALNRRPGPSDYHVSVCFSADQACKDAIRSKLKALLVEVGKMVSETKKEQDMFYLGMDLF